MVSPQPVDAAIQGPIQPGWYNDPWHVAQWRWYDGHMWTSYQHSGNQTKKPFLPSWLSVPLIPAMIITFLAVMYTAVTQPIVIALGLVPMIFVLPAMAWLDRVEPEPRSSQIHAILWGACVAALVSGVVNTIAASAISDDFAAVVSAPLIEELTKGLGIYWAVRRREVDGVMDGIVYAGWTALGFAVVEDFLYFSNALAAGNLGGVFILRALLTPFAHPLFTMWIGLGIGWAVSRNKPVFPFALLGYVLAAASHAFWNGSLVFSAQMESQAGLLVAVICFILLFFSSVIAVIIIRQRTVNEFVAAIPLIAQRYGMSQQEVMVFGNWRQLLHTRRSLPRSHRKNFDKVHRALARLGCFHSRPGSHDATEEQILVNQLQAARQGN